MVRFGNGGSIILVASMSGSITNKVRRRKQRVFRVARVVASASERHNHGKTQDHAWVSYNTSKSAVLQMARSMACELGTKGIRVNTLSPGHIYTSYVHSSHLIWLKNRKLSLGWMDVTGSEFCLTARSGI